MSLEMMILLNSFGHDARPSQSEGAAGVLMLPVERVGVLKEIDGREGALAVPVLRFGEIGAKAEVNRWQLLLPQFRAIPRA
jgi:hypothetical protein